MLCRVASSSTSDNTETKQPRAGAATVAYGRSTAGNPVGRYPQEDGQPHDAID